MTFTYLIIQSSTLHPSTFHPSTFHPSTFHPSNFQPIRAYDAFDHIKSLLDININASSVYSLKCNDLS